MNGELSRSKEEGNIKNISSNSIRLNEDYNSDKNACSHLKLQNNQVSRNSDEPIKRNKIVSSRKITIKKQ
ncbi:hypothetical protein EJD97_012585 [Solanum chilense]|uniref:Uncharacterized protein n=1 Tax=Solanum chilense TaxID=4083 RepID=A0A6N2AFP3_SOLCI|nr:hypothetical protein EJD97_012585 [Solanum chilense]